MFGISIKGRLSGLLSGFAVAATLSFCGQALAAEWKLAHILAPGHPVHHALEESAASIEKRTEGRIKIKVFPSAQLGSGPEIITGMTLGSIEMNIAGPGMLSRWNPRLSVLEAPYLAKDFDHLTRIYQSPTFQEIVTQLRQDHGIRMLGMWNYGARHITNSKHEIKSAADLKGLKLRVSEIALSLEWAKALGMTPTPIPFSELYLSLQTGIVDGQETPLSSIISSKYYEVQRHLALTGHVISGVMPLIAESAWSSISPEDQRVVEEEFAASGVRYSKYVLDQEEAMTKDLEKRGMTVTRPDVSSMQSAMGPLYAKFAEIWGAGTFEKLRDTP